VKVDQEQWIVENVHGVRDNLSLVKSNLHPRNKNERSAVTDVNVFS
jgi:hypothetical protein